MCWIIFQDITVFYDFCYIITAGIFTLLLALQHSYFDTILDHIGTCDIVLYIIRLSPMIYFVHLLIITIVQRQSGLILLNANLIILVIIITLIFSSLLLELNKKLCAILEDYLKKIKLENSDF